MSDSSNKTLELPHGGMIHRSSPYSVAETVQRLEAVLRERAIPVLGRVDHSSGAAGAGFEMRPTQLLIFGAAKAGTPLMLAAPTAALDLPLKTLVWEDTDGKVWISYNSPEYLQLRHGFPKSLIANIAGIWAVIEAAVRVQ